MTSALPPGMIDGVRGLNGTRRFLAFGAVAVALIVMWTMYRYADQPTLVTLYRGLELREAAAMADALTKGSIAFELTSGGTEILVPAAAVAQARVAIAKQGIRADGEKPGNELLDGPNWGRTESEMKSLERRALEGELAKTLEQLHGIERAAVHLGVPETSALRKLDRPAKASVVITARGGRALSSEEVASITYLVANAVPALNPDQVAVLDADGRLLSAPNDAAAGGLTSRQLDQQSRVEHYLAASAEKMLATVLGTGGAQVTVSARLDVEQKETTSESYNPDGAVLQNEQRSEASGADSLDGGTSTVVNNTYLNSRVVEKVTGAPGQIEQLTVAVLIDQKAIEKVAGPGASLAQELPRYEQIVRDAIGMDSTRGDRITVNALPFEPLVLVADSGTSEGGGTEQVLVVVERFSRPVVGLVGILAAFLLALKALKPARGGATGGGAAGTGGRSLGGAGGGDDDGDGERELPAVKVPALSASTSKLKNEVQAESTQRPDMAASVVKAWLTQDA